QIAKLGFDHGRASWLMRVHHCARSVNNALPKGLRTRELQLNCSGRIASSESHPDARSAIWNPGQTHKPWRWIQASLWLLCSPYSLLPLFPLISRPTPEHFFGAAEVLIERSHGLGEIARVVAAPSRARLADDDAKPLRARIAGHPVRLEPRERQHPARAAHMALVRRGHQHRVAIAADLHRQHCGAVRLHRL